MGFKEYISLGWITISGSMFWAKKMRQVSYMVQILITFAQIILGSDKNGICQILKIVKFHLEKQNAFLSAMVVVPFALSAGIATF